MTARHLPPPVASNDALLPSAYSNAVLAGVENNIGALLREGGSDSPATKARLLPGDVVIWLDGIDVNGVYDLFWILDRDRIDRTLEMDVPRMGRLRVIDIHPVERPDGGAAGVRHSGQSPSLRGAVATKQSSLSLRPAGLLRCARNNG